MNDEDVEACPMCSTAPLGPQETPMTDVSEYDLFNEIIEGFTAEDFEIVVGNHWTRTAYVGLSIEELVRARCGIKLSDELEEPEDYCPECGCPNYVGYIRCRACGEHWDAPPAQEPEDPSGPGVIEPELRSLYEETWTALDIVNGAFEALWANGGGGPFEVALVAPEAAKAMEQGLAKAVLTLNEALGAYEHVLAEQRSAAQGLQLTADAAFCVTRKGGLG